MTFTADASCTQIPAALRTRTYSAVIDRPNRPGYRASTFTAALGDADFVEGYSTMWGNVDHDDARVLMWSWDAFNWWLEDHPILERSSATSHLALSDLQLRTIPSRVRLQQSPPASPPIIE